MGVHRGTLTALVAEAVDNGVLDAQRGEVQASERRALRHHVHADRLPGIEPVFPGQGVAQPVERVLVAAGRIQQAQQHAAGQPRFQVDAVGQLQVAPAADSARPGVDVVCTQGAQLVGQRRFQPARARTEIMERAGRRRGGGLVARGGVASWGVSSVSPVAGGFGRMAAGRAKGDHERKGMGGIRAGSARRAAEDQNGLMITIATTISSRMTGPSLKTRNQRSECERCPSANFRSRRPQPWW